MKVPQLTVGPNVRRACEPVHMGGCKYLRSTAQTCKEACQVRVGSKAPLNRYSAASGLPREADVSRVLRYVSTMRQADSGPAARRSCVRLRFRGDGRRQRAMMGASSPAKQKISRRTAANPLTNLTVDPFGRMPELEFCAVCAKPARIRTAAEQATAGDQSPRTAVSWRKASAARSCSAR